MSDLNITEWLQNIDAGLSSIGRILAEQNSDKTPAFHETTEVLGRTLEASRVGIWLFNPDRTKFVCSDLFDLATASHHQGTEVDVTECNGIISLMENPEIVFSDDGHDLLQLSSYVSKAFSKPASGLHAAIKMADQFIGVLCVEHVGQPRHWQQDEILLARITANFAPVLIRAQTIVHTEEELKRNLSLLTGTLESTDEAIVVVNLDRTISLSNHRFREMVGLSPTDNRALEKTTVASLLLGLTKYPERIKIGSELLYTSPEQQAIFQLEFKDGRVFEIFTLPQRIEGKIVGRIFSYRDVTERIRNEQTRAKLQSQLRHAQKMEAIGTLAGGIAHDFNNILSGVICNLELARGDIAADHPAQESLGDIMIATRRAADLVKQILAFSRPQVPERKSIHIESVLEEALKLMRASIPALIDLNVELPPGLPPILADPTQIHQVVMNLCTNAWQAIGHSAGVIQVKAHVVTVDGALAEQNHDLHLGDYLRLTVSDNGCGMDAATIERAFDPFFSTKTPDKGTGLGLSVVHGIMRAHEGAIIVESEPGQGTTFYLYFPIRLVVDEPDMLVHLSVQRGHGESILLVDDEPSLVEAGRRTLERLGYRVTALHSARDAIAMFSRNPYSFDAAVCDLTMPVMTGAELATQLHTIKPNLPIILVTGNADGMTPQQLHDSLIRELLFKPLSAQLLGDALYRALHLPQSTST